MAPPLLALRDVHLTFGGTPLLVGADLQVARGDRICLVGRNGSGKSTFLKIAAGTVDQDRGERFVQPGTALSVLPQEPDLDDFETVGAYVADAFSDPADSHRGTAMLAALDLTGAEHPATLSGGELRRAALAKTLAPDPDIVLLDEPTNHLDLPTITWLEETIAQLTSAVVLISHDRRFLERLTRATVWLERGTTRRLDKGFEAFEAWRDEVFAAEEDAAHKLDRKIVREEHWLQGGVTGRRKRNVKRLATLQDMRERRRTAQARTGDVRLEASEAEASGARVIEAVGLTKAYDDAPPLVRNLSIRLTRGDRLGVIGPNGAGKTTLVKMLIGELEPDRGRIKLGSNLERVWLDQKRDALNDNATLSDVLTGGRGDTVFINGRPRHVATYLKDFLFLPEQARSPVSVLSGGERARLLLARALATPSNLMVLDEPTNDLDLETLDLLQELLSDYAGTLLLISHDRDFIDRICTSVLASEGDGHWTEYAGGYSDMIAQRRAAERQEPAGRAASAGKADRIGTAAARNAESQARPKQKLSFKEKHALETLPGEIEALEQEIAALTAKLSDPGLFQSDPTAFAKHTERLTATQAELAAAEDRWLELEALRESLEG